jgi:hypothetical protein
MLGRILRRVGETPEQRLRWVVDFTRRDLDLLHPGELEALGWDLRLIAAHSQPRGGSLTTTMTPLASAPCATISSRSIGVSGRCWARMPSGHSPAAHVSKGGTGSVWSSKAMRPPGFSAVLRASS